MYDDEGCGGEETGLQKGWSADYRSRVSLIEAALEYCDPGGQVSLFPIDEDRARFLLRKNNMVDVL